MSHWRATRFTNSKSISAITIKCGIYQGDARSRLLFCIAFHLLSTLLENSGYEYRLKNGTTIKHLFYINDIKRYANNEQDVNLLLRLTQMFGSDIGMKFGLAKCWSLIVNRSTVKSTSGIGLPEGRIDDINKRYKYLKILQSFGCNDVEVRWKATYRYKTRSKAVFWGGSSVAKNKVTAINTSLTYLSDTRLR